MCVCVCVCAWAYTNSSTSGRSVSATHTVCGCYSWRNPTVGPNTETVLLNSIAHRWTGKKGPNPATHPSHFAAWGGMDTDNVGVGDFADFLGFDFRPAKSSSGIIGHGVVHPPQVPGPNGSHVDVGAYQHDDPSPWRPGCTFTHACGAGVPPPGPPTPPAPPPPPCSAEAGFDCERDAYCGPRYSYYWSGALNLSACLTKCAANTTGCACADVLVGAGSGGAGSAGSSRLGTDSPTCRLHASAGDVIPSGRGYDAYWRNKTL